MLCIFFIENFPFIFSSSNFSKKRGSYKKLHTIGIFYLKYVTLATIGHLFVDFEFSKDFATQ